MDKYDFKYMIETSKLVVNKYDKDKALAVLDNLMMWADSCDEIHLESARDIALGYGDLKTPVRSDSNPEINKDLMWLYGEAAKHGRYSTELLEAGIKAGRGSKILHRLASEKFYKKEEFDLVGYASNPEWSDYWIEQIDFCENYIVKHKAHGIDLMSIFTPKHSPNVFYEMCYHISDDIDYDTDFSWLSDINWTTSVARGVLYLYSNMRGRDWGNIIRPWMCEHIISDIRGCGSMDPIVHQALIDKWKNVSPLLDYVLDKRIAYESVEQFYDEYSNIRYMYGCDGDELAGKIHNNQIPADVMKRNEYYHSMVTRAGSKLNAATIMGGE